MKNNTSIDKLDSYLLSKKDSEVKVIFAMAFCLIVFIVYYFVFPISSDFLAKYTRLHTTTQNSLLQEETYKNNNQNRPGQLTEQIEDIKDKIYETKYINGHVDNKLRELSYLLFNDKSWASFMDRLTFLSKKYKINVIKISNDFLDQNNQTREKVQQMLNVDMELNGNFNSILKFVNEIEESQLVVDVNKIDLTSSKGINGNISIAVWGMLY